MGKTVPYQVLNALFDGVEQMQDVIFWVRDHEKQIYVSRSYESVYGASCDSLYDSTANWLGNFNRPDREAIADLTDARNMHTGYGEGIEVCYDFSMPDGEHRFVRDVSFGVYQQGVLVGNAGVAMPMQERAYDGMRLRVLQLKGESHPYLQSLQDIVQKDIRTHLAS
ncbi:MAG: hypothetical protein DHS20C10_08720 [marine bacterium B5-7]|nr:MAG: hypothetical protein DHS20C10_08720 [marine bacterium B5-7]